MPKSKVRSDTTKESEDCIQMAIMEWLRHINIDPYVIHIPNEGKRSWNYGKKLKKMGMKKGVSDLFIALPKHNYHGAWIELKTKKGRLTPSQSEFIKDMLDVGYFAKACYGLDDAMTTIKWYLKHP